VLILFISFARPASFYCEEYVHIYIYIYIYTFLTPYRSHMNYRCYQTAWQSTHKGGFSTLHTGHIYPARNIPITNFYLRLRWTQDPSAAGRIMSKFEGQQGVSNERPFGLVAQPNALLRCINYVIIICIKGYNARIIIMEDSKILFVSSKFPWARERISSKYVDNLGTGPR
jgi:hypothetical protein